MSPNIAVPINPIHDSRWTWPINVGSTLGVTAGAAYGTSSWPILNLFSTSCHGSTSVPGPTPWAPGFHEFASFYDPMLSTSTSCASYASHRSDPFYDASTSTRLTPASAPVHSTRPNVNISFGNPHYPSSLQPTSPSHVVTSQHAYTSTNANTPHTPVPSSSSLAEPAVQYDRTGPLAGSTPRNLPSFSWLEPLPSTSDSLRSTSHPASRNSAHPINRDANNSILTPPSVNPIIQPPPVPGSNQSILTYHVHQLPFSAKLRNSASFFRGQFYREQAFSFGQTVHVEPDRLDLYLDSDDNHVDSWFMERWGPIPILPSSSYNRRCILQDSSMRFASRPEDSTGSTTTPRFVIEDVLQGIANYFQQGMSIEETRLAKQMIGERTLREERQRRWDHSDSNENDDRIPHLSSPEGHGVSGFEPAYLRCDVLRGRLKFGGIYVQRMGDGTSFKLVLRLLPMRRVRFAL